MALSEIKKGQLRILVKLGKLSNVEIAKEIGTSEKTVRNFIKKEELIKSEITDLAKREVQSIIVQDQIKFEKSELSPSESEAYNTVLITEVQSQNLALNVNHKLLLKIHDDIETGTKLEKVNSGKGYQRLEEVEHGSSDHLNHAKAIQTVTDNLGITQRHAPKIDVTQNNQQNNKTTEITIKVIE